MDPIFICPRCRSPLESRGETEQYCPGDNLRFEKREDIWHFLLPEREAYFGQFISEYQQIREAEERFSDDPEYFRGLPFHDLSQRRAADWRIRSISYKTFLNKIVEPLEKSQAGLHIMDIGAGNCWLSFRLAQRGHRLTAVDLLVNKWDGLGAHHHYPVSFVPVQAEFDRLPFAGQQYDLIVFNASFHYSENYTITLVEALRCLKPGGQIVLLDSPIYSDPQSGKQMVLERESQFEAKYGTKSNALRSENFMTHARLAALEKELSISWRYFRPFYGLRWMLRPALAAIRKHRQPASFIVLAAHKG